MVNPARAGMIPRLGGDLAELDGKPRASGDDPQLLSDAPAFSS